MPALCLLSLISRNSPKQLGMVSPELKGIEEIIRCLRQAKISVTFMPCVLVGRLGRHGIPCCVSGSCSAADPEAEIVVVMDSQHNTGGFDPPNDVFILSFGYDPIGKPEDGEGIQSSLSHSQRLVEALFVRARRSPSCYDALPPSTNLDRPLPVKRDTGVSERSPID